MSEKNTDLLQKFIKILQLMQKVKLELVSHELGISEPEMFHLLNEWAGIVPFKFNNGIISQDEFYEISILGENEKNRTKKNIAEVSNWTIKQYRENCSKNFKSPSYMSVPIFFNGKLLPDDKTFSELSIDIDKERIVFLRSDGAKIYKEVRMHNQNKYKTNEMPCPYCGKTIRPTAKHCIFCGKKL